jgi:hypothetical protein
MKNIILCALLALWSTSLVARDRTFVPVASYLNQPDLVQKDGNAAVMLLKERNLTNFVSDRLDEAAWAKWRVKWKGVVGSDSLVIFVPKDESPEARLILARAIKAERLRITLRGDDGATVSAESILEPSKKP